MVPVLLLALLIIGCFVFFSNHFLFQLKKIEQKIEHRANAGRESTDAADEDKKPLATILKTIHSLQRTVKEQAAKKAVDGGDTTDGTVVPVTPPAYAVDLSSRLAKVEAYLNEISQSLRGQQVAFGVVSDQTTAAQKASAAAITEAERTKLQTQQTYTLGNAKAFHEF